MNVMIVEAERLLRSILVRLCARELRFTIVAEMGTGSEIQIPARDRAPDLLILGVEMPNVDGLEALTSLRTDLPSVKVLLLASYCTPRLAYRVGKACVQGFLDRSSDGFDTLRAALVAIADGHSYFSESYWQAQSERRQQTAAYEKLLTDKERLVFEMLGRLMDDEEIAETMQVSMRTLEGHRLRIMHKLNVPTRVALLRYARAMGLLQASVSPFTQRDRTKNRSPACVIR